MKGSHTMKTMKEKVTDLDAFTAKKERQQRKQQYERLRELQAMPADDYSRADEIHDLILAGADLEFEAWIEGEIKARKDSGLSRLAWSIAELADCEKRKDKTEAETLEYLRTFYLGHLLADEDGQPIPAAEGQGILTADGTFIAAATVSDIDTAIDDVKQAGLWPWKATGA